MLYSSRVKGFPWLNRRRDFSKPVLLDTYAMKASYYSFEHIGYAATKRGVLAEIIDQAAFGLTKQILVQLPNRLTHLNKRFSYLTLSYLEAI